MAIEILRSKRGRAVTQNDEGPFPLSPVGERAGVRGEPFDTLATNPQ